MGSSFKAASEQVFIPEFSQLVSADSIEDVTMIRGGEKVTVKVDMTNACPSWRSCCSGRGSRCGPYPECAGSGCTDKPCRPVHTHSNGLRSGVVNMVGNTNYTMYFDLDGNLAAFTEGANGGLVLITNGWHNSTITWQDPCRRREPECWKEQCC